MSRSKVLFSILTLCLSLFVSSCDKEKQRNRDQQQLEQLYTKIKSLAEVSTCNGTDNSQLKSTAIGASPCGGPSHYLAYSTSIDVKEFERLVKKYSAMQDAYNKKWNIAGVCIITATPKSVTCENGKPKLVY